MVTLSIRKTGGRSGFTLTEVVTVMVISGILFIMLGMIVVSAANSEKATIDITRAEADYRYFLKRVEYKIRNAMPDDIVVRGKDYTGWWGECIEFAEYRYGGPWWGQIYQPYGGDKIRYWSQFEEEILISNVVPHSFRIHDSVRDGRVIFVFDQIVTDRPVRKTISRRAAMIIRSKLGGWY